MVWSESQLATIDEELSVFIVGMVEEKSAENGGTSMSCANALPRYNFHIHVQYSIRYQYRHPVSPYFCTETS